jgi:hypothetical protein
VCLSKEQQLKALRRITERNLLNRSPFDLAIEKGDLNCVKHLVFSSWLELNIDMRELINSSSMKKAIDEDQLDILTFLVSHPKRFAYIIDLLIDFNGHYFNLVS